MPISICTTRIGRHAYASLAAGAAEVNTGHHYADGDSRRIGSFQRYASTRDSREMYRHDAHFLWNA